MDPTVWVGGGAVVSLVSLSIGLLVRMMRTVPGAYASQIKQQGDAIGRLEETCQELRDTNSRCERRVELLIKSMRREGISVPKEVWEQ